MSFTSSATPGIAATNATASDAPSLAPRLAVADLTMAHGDFELASIFAIADRAVFLNADARTMIALGNPKPRDASPEAKVRAFLTRDEHEAGGSG